MSYKVYIIRNGEGRLYIGMSEDVVKRLTDHNMGVSTWTKHRGPWELVWHSESMGITAARKLENLLKRQKGGRGLYELTGMSRPTESGS